ncbi:hypothetical protein FISHEDRAFT_75591 [Fistulina hepatica ATCC 64428]|uniref:Uncharacterized protein n=1 Tax=Fistulina hepatica ATCC 64428 TaxID=1128425 RepID=A0A0D7A6R5_9AGAR|nr:hypothetical protein FISHEDRAFT_75591 [Fistulina hepatica ATCC 64428]
MPEAVVCSYTGQLMCTTTECDVRVEELDNKTVIVKYPLFKVYAFVRVSPIEAVIWLAGVIVLVFGTVEDSIYTKICALAALLLVRVAMLRGDCLGHVRVEGAGNPSDAEITSTVRDLYVPLLPPPNTSRSVAASASTSVTPAAAGMIICRIEEGTIYPNVARLNVAVVALEHG